LDYNETVKESKVIVCPGPDGGVIKTSGRCYSFFRSNPWVMPSWWMGMEPRRSMLNQVDKKQKAGIRDLNPNGCHHKGIAPNSPHFGSHLPDGWKALPGLVFEAYNMG
jgi:hypothetical protein